MRCDEFVKEWQRTETCGEIELSAAAATHLAVCPMCQAMALAPPSVDAALRKALAARALRATPRAAAIAAATEAAVAALAPRPAPRRQAKRRGEPLRFVALPPALTGWAVAAALLIMVGLLGRAPFGANDAQVAAQTATAIAALPSATPSPTISLATPPTAVSMARPAATPLPPQ